MTHRAPLHTRIDRRRLRVDEQVPNLLLGVLAGQDQFFGAPGQAPTFDWPNPVEAQYPVELLTWTENLLQTTLQAVEVEVVPFRNQEWPVPQRRPFPPELLQVEDWITTYVVPFANIDWPSPARRKTDVGLRTWQVNLLQTTLASAEQQAPFKFVDWPMPPLRRRARTDLHTWASTTVHLIGQDTFFGPPGMPPSYDWPNPVRRARAFAWHLEQTSVAIVATLSTPFTQMEWPMPHRRRAIVTTTDTGFSALIYESIANGDVRESFLAIGWDDTFFDVR